MKKRIEQLTGLRFFAALLVFFSHFGWANTPDYIKSFFHQGYVGVSFFFVLSGFVLSHSYKNKIENGVLSFKKYFLLRLARLTPLHFATAAFFIVPLLLYGGFDIFKTVINLAYLQSWVPNSDYYFSLNMPSWSLSNEMFFYGCFYFLVFFSFRSLFITVLVFLLVLVMSAFVYELFFHGTKIWGTVDFSHWLFYIFPVSRLLEFMVGMVLYFIWSKGYILRRESVVFAYVFLFLAMYFGPNVPASFRYSLYYLPVIAFFLYSHLTYTFISEFYSNKWLILLGNASFAFYLIHQYLIVEVSAMIYTRYNLPDFAFFVTMLLITSFLSIVIYVLYESKSEAALKYLINKWLD